MFQPPHPPIDSKIILIITILILIVKLCPNKKCYVCFYRYSKRFKQLLEKIEKRKIRDEIFYRENIQKIVASTYARTWEIVTKCRVNHGKSQKKFDCTKCLAELFMHYLSQVAPWTKNLHISDMYLIVDFYYEIISEVWDKCDSFCKKEISNKCNCERKK